LGLDVAGLVALSATLAVHLVATVWWAASLTKRVEHLEKWMTANAHTAERLAALDQQLENLSAGVARIEHYLRHSGR
jgi:hypothetical protein